MTDGAGRLSQSLAYKINNQLGLSYLPSGFQGRIGEAKGLWTVDVNDERPGDWIELYASQITAYRTESPACTSRSSCTAHGVT